MRYDWSACEYWTCVGIQHTKEEKKPTEALKWPPQEQVHQSENHFENVVQNHLQFYILK